MVFCVRLAPVVQQAQVYIHAHVYTYMYMYMHKYSTTNGEVILYSVLYGLHLYSGVGCIVRHANTCMYAIS